MSFYQSISFDRLRRALRGPLRSVKGDRRTAADYRLASRIADLLEEIRFADAEAVSIYVRNESVVLTGTVYSVAECEMLTGLIRRIPGVRRVVSRLGVVGRGEEYPEIPPDLP